jgi:DNA repair protein REV1
MGILQDDESLSNQPSQSKMESFPHLQPTLSVVSSDNCQQVADLDGGHAAPTCESVKEVDDCNETGNENILQNSKSQSTELPSHKKGSAGHQLERETREEPFASEDPGLVTNDKYIKGRIRTVGNDPMFLESFFSSSRLSFIGSYKQRIQKSTAKQDQTCRNPSKGDHRFVFHIDMDCFFASVVLRNYPEYRNLPVAISHHGKRGDGADKQNVVSKNSTSECATCNYEARKYGITKGMYLGRAKELCPELVVLYYDFEGYEEVSEQVAEILQRQAFAFNGSVEQVSCDEAYVELFIPPDAVSGTSFELAGEIAEGIRQEIFSETQCTASVGVGANKLLAKLATDKVKPNGSFVVRDYRELLKSLRLRDLHGVGYRMDRRLSDEGLNCVSDVWDLGDRAEGTLCRILGAGLGKRILHFCKGEDDRPVKPVERKTIGAEVSFILAELAVSSTYSFILDL